MTLAQNAHVFTTNHFNTGHTSMLFQSHMTNNNHNQQQSPSPTLLQSTMSATTATTSASTVLQKRPLHQHNMQHPPSIQKPIKPKSVGKGSANLGTIFSHLQPGASKIRPYPTHQPQTVSVQRRNARERNRVKQVNNGFTTLRQHIPTDVVAALSNGGRGASKKLSKVDTLKVAVEYIRRLEDLLDEVVNDENAMSVSSASSASSSSSSSLLTSSSSNTSTASGSNNGLNFTTLYGCGNVSPTPSYASSSVSSSVSTSSSSLQPHESQSGYKFEPEDAAAYDPDDEELLDCITWWQQQ